MDIETVISILGLLGFGGITGSYLQHLWNQKRETESRIQELNENKYRSTLIFMRLILNPSSLDHASIPDEKVYRCKSNKELVEYAKKSVKEFYYLSILYAPQTVLLPLQEFISNPTTENYIKTALAMRNDLWKKDKIDLNIHSLVLD